MQILLQLKGAGLVASARGAAGGYQLARTAEITLADVLDVIDPPESTAVGRTGDVSPLAAALRAKWGEIAEARRAVLEGTTLADLIAAGAGSAVRDLGESELLVVRSQCRRSDVICKDLKAVDI